MRHLTGPPPEDPFHDSVSPPAQPYGHTHSPAASNLPSESSLDGRVGPSEYDRFPSRIGSRAVLSSSLSLMGYRARGGALPGGAGGPPDADAPADPFHDFSPFGGYPALLFPLHIDEQEPDDYLHNPDPIADAEYDRNRFLYDLKTLDRRLLGGLVGVVCLVAAAMLVFVMLPVLTYSNVTHPPLTELYEVLTAYKYPLLSALRPLVDPDTPQSARLHTSRSGAAWPLVFSDEFAAEGRTFYDGDDQFWQAVDLWYGGTKDLEWYDPDAASTANGTLNLRMDAFKNHNLFYRLGMVQLWNKFCFTQGMLEISARLPNYGNVLGLWPGLWLMGNLGRPGYMGSTEGVWPYSYDLCDAGITPNQSSPDGILYLPGQKLNACTCRGEDHPNAGTGRGAPEIDAIEAEADSNIHIGVALQLLQIAPMDIWYMPDYSWVQVHNASKTTMNTYAGGPIQQAILGTTTLNTTWYEFGSADRFQTYGFEYLNDNDNGYVTWYVGEPTLTVHAWAMAPNGNVGWRRILKEPMLIVMNLGVSNSWAYIDWASLHFPVTFSIDYVRVYQPEDEINVTCDPPDYPTYNYIQEHLPAFEVHNYTSWEEAGFKFPKNKLVNGCT
jgi:beta-glucanase (GH16 family)